MHPFLDFTAAFGKISHTYLFRMLTSCVYSMRFITLTQAMYDQAFSSDQINGYVPGPIPIRCSVSQGCPMSMLLFALVLNQLLYLLERNLTGIRNGHRTSKIAVVAYADDVTIFVTAPEDIQAIGDFLLTYERATGTCLNIRKYEAMAAGSWGTSINMMDIPYYPEITIPGFRFTGKVARSGNVPWSRVTGKIKAQTSGVYGRYLRSRDQKFPA